MCVCVRRQSIMEILKKESWYLSLILRSDCIKMWPFWECMFIVYCYTALQAVPNISSRTRRNKLVSVKNNKMKPSLKNSRFLLHFSCCTKHVPNHDFCVWLHPSVWSYAPKSEKVLEMCKIKRQQQNIKKEEIKRHLTEMSSVNDWLMSVIQFSTYNLYPSLMMWSVT